MFSFNIPGTADQAIDHRNDEILQQLAPDAFGPYGFDGHRANLLVRGMVMPANLKEALSKRVEEELTDRASARFAKSLDRFNPPFTKEKAKPTATPSTKQKTKTTAAAPTKQKAKATVAAKSLPRDDYSDRALWTEENTRELVRLHAQRVPFKQIAEQIEGKQVKGCQASLYRALKEPKWDKLHSELRESHDAMQRQQAAGDEESAM